MKKLKIIPIFLLLLLLIINVTAYTEYESIGLNNFKSDTTSYFNSALSIDDDVIPYSKGINDPYLYPLVADLDGDGVKEIVVVDGTSIRLFNNLSLDIVDSVDIGSGTITGIELFDITGDGNDDIVLTAFISYSSAKYYVYSYNGTINSEVEDTFTKADLGTLSGYSAWGDNGFNNIFLKCISGTNTCLVVGSVTASEKDGEFDPYHYANFYQSNIIDSSGLVSNQTLFYRSTTGSNSINYGYLHSAFPVNMVIDSADYDNDGTTEYFITSCMSRSSCYISVFNLTGTSTSAEDHIALVSSGSATEWETRTPTTTNLVSSPMVYNFDQSYSNGKEIIAGVSEGSNEFKIQMFKANGDDYDQFPYVLNADGVMISNPIRGNFFTETGDIDFCILGYQSVQEKLDLVCGSPLTSGTETYEFKTDTTFNVTSGNNIYNTMIHTIEASNTLTSSVNLDEVLTPYGVYSLDYSDDYDPLEFGFVFKQEIGLRHDDVAIIPVDYNGDDREEIIYLTATNLWLFTDGYINQPVNTFEVFSNPCYEGTIKINTSWDLLVTPEDPEADDVSARVILYYGETNEQDSGWSTNVSSGSTITFSLTPNATISSGTLRVMAKDVVNGEVLSEDLSFSVGNDGFEYGDSSCSASTTTITDEETAQEEAVADFEEDLQDAFDGIPLIGGVFSGFFTLSIITLLFILAVSAGTYERTKHPLLAVGVFMVLFIIVSIAGLIPIYWVLVVLLLFIAIYWLYHMLRRE